jgi:hypothetical protein
MKLFFWSHMCEPRCSNEYCQECLIQHGTDQHGTEPYIDYGNQPYGNQPYGNYPTAYDSDQRREEIANAMWLKLSRIEDKLDKILAVLA